MRVTPRTFFAAVFVACASLLSYGYFYLQEYKGLDPCPMCILQRYAFVMVGLIALAGAIHGPRGLALKGYALGVALFAIAGAGVAVRHSWLQHFPPLRETCGTDLEFLLNTFPLTQALPKIFAGTGSCSKVDWSFLAGAIWIAFFKRPPEMKNAA